MDVSNVCSRIRSELLDDEIEPYLWSDINLINYLNETLQELSDETLLTKDQTTAATCTITLVNATGRYALPSGIIQVKAARVTHDSKDTELIVTTESWMNDNAGDWRNQSSTGVTHVIPSSEEGYLRVYPYITTVDDEVITLTVIRSPATEFTTSDITAATTITGMRVAYTDAVMNGMAKRAFLKPDSETYDRGKSEHFRMLFELDKKRIRRKLILLNKPTRTHTIRSGQGTYF